MAIEAASVVERVCCERCDLDAGAKGKGFRIIGQRRHSDCGGWETVSVSLVAVASPDLYSTGRHSGPAHHPSDCWDQRADCPADTRVNTTTKHHSVSSPNHTDPPPVECVKKLFPPYPRNVFGTLPPPPPTPPHPPPANTNPSPFTPLLFSWPHQCRAFQRKAPEHRDMLGFKSRVIRAVWHGQTIRHQRREMNWPGRSFTPAPQSEREFRLRRSCVQFGAKDFRLS